MRAVPLCRARGLYGVAIGVLAAALTGSARAHAEDDTDHEARLRLVYEAPRECEGASRFHERVISLVRTPPRKWKSSVEVRVTIERAERGFVGRLGLVQRDATEHEPSERALRATTCASVFEALAVSAALAVDDALEESAASEPVTPGEKAEAPQAPAPPPSRMPPRSTLKPIPPRPRRPFELRIGDALALREGLAPDRLLLQTASISLARLGSFWPPPLRGELTFGASPVIRTPYGAYRARLVEVALAACTPTGQGLFGVLGLCAGVGGGVLATSSFEVLRPAERERPWGVAFVAPRVSIPVVTGLRLVVEGRMVLPFFRESQNFYPGITVYDAPAAALQVAIGLEVSLPPLGP
jgi:hypothetical protein